MIAALSLGKTGGARAVDLLIKALKDDVAYVRWEAATSLGCIGDTKAVKALIHELRAADALKKINDTQEGTS